MAHVAILSFRLGGTDGVSIEAAKWAGALGRLGHRITTVAGQGPVDRLVPGLAIGAPTPARRDVEAALADADLVIVENLGSLPLNPGARDVVWEVLDQRAALWHHHDLASQRPALAHLAGVRDRPRWRHVTINGLSARELADQGVEATVLMNSFDCDPPPGRRETTRAALDIGAERLVLAPTRAIERKNIAGALTLAERLGAVLWLLGPAEDGYGSVLEALITSSGADVRRGAPTGVDVHDAYAACDLVVMASTWEGFGNPVLESVTHRRPLALNPYPVAHEITSRGFRFLGLEDVAALRREIHEPDEARLATNLAVARTHFNLDDLPARLARVLEPFEI